MPLTANDMLVLKVLADADNPEGVLSSELCAATGLRWTTVRSILNKLIGKRCAFQRFGVWQYCISKAGRLALRIVTVPAAEGLHSQGCFVGAAIRQARQDADLSIRELAELAGLSERTVSNYELGRTIPSLFHRHILARALNKPDTSFD